jgi:hypothetical protein
MGLTFASDAQQLSLCKTQLTEATRSHTLPYVNQRLRLTYTQQVEANPRFQGQRFGFRHPRVESGRHSVGLYAVVKYLALSLFLCVTVTVTSRRKRTEVVRGSRGPKIKGNPCGSHPTGVMG